MKGGFRLGGTLLGGVNIYDLEISGEEGALERAVVDRLETDYRFMELIKGKVRGISGEGIHVDIRLVETEKEEKPPMDFQALGKTLNGVRDRILPLELDLEDVSLSVKKDGARVVALEDSDFSHETGEDLIALDLGRIIDAAGRFTQPQEAKLVWEEGRLTLDRLDLLPIVGIRDLAVSLPEDGDIAANVDVRLSDALLRVTVGEGIKDVRLDMVEGGLDFGKVLGGFGLGLPIEGNLTSLAVEMKQVFPEWQTAVGTAELFVENFSYDGWDVPEASLGITLEEGNFGAKLVGRALGSGVTVTAGGDFERSEIIEGKFDLDRIAGNLEIENVEEVLVALDGKFDMPVDFAEFPESGIAGDWAVDLGEEGFGGAEGDITLTAGEADATPIRVKARYEDNVVTVSDFEADGMVFSGKFDLAAKTYEAKQVLDGFDSSRLVPWLEGIGQTAPGSAVVSMDWEASGNYGENRNRGTLEGLDIVWQWKEGEDGTTRPPVSATADAITYDWPGTVDLDGLVVETQGQVVKLEAKLAEQLLDLEKFSWLEGETELAEGYGKLPVPEDFSKFKEFLGENTEPIDLKIETKTLPLSKLRPWVPALEQIDGDATGKVEIAIGGESGGSSRWMPVWSCARSARLPRSRCRRRM